MSWFTNLLYNTDAEEERGHELDRQRIAYNQKLVEEGKRSQQWLAETQANDERSRIDNVDQQVEEAFWEGWDEGKQNIRNTVGEVVSTPFQLIPGIVWVLALVALFIWMGGFQWLKGGIKRWAK